MAYEFTAASSQYLTTASTPVLSEPLTLACWFNRKTVGSQHSILAIDRGVNSGTGFHVLNLGSATNVVTAASNDGTAAQAIGTTTYSLNTWNHACGVFSSNSSRTSYLNGQNAVTNTTSKNVTGLSNITVGGRFSNGSLSGPSNAFIAEVGVWNVALTADEIASLAKGMTCDKIRPQNLVFYAPSSATCKTPKAG